MFTMDRDVCLAYRFYFYYQVLRKRFDDALSDMEREFFISSATISARLTENDVLLKDIISNKPTRAALKKRYPHLNWS